MLRIAAEQEVETLVNMSTVAFDTDTDVGATEKIGPPMYTSLEWHQSIQKMNILYSIFENGELVGGAIVYPNEKNPDWVEIGRIFIDPRYFRKGYGKKAMTDIEKLFPSAKGFNLDTPLWNKRTYSLYTGLGYTEAKRDAYLIYFEKAV